MKILYVLLFICVTSFSSVEISLEKNKILSDCQYFVELSNYSSLDKVKNTFNNKWLYAKKNSLSAGYYKDKKIWIKCIFKNEKDFSTIRILENENPHVTYLTFFDDNVKKELGIIFRSKSNKTLTPYVVLKFKPKEIKTIYLNFQSTLGPLNIKLLLWEVDAFVKKVNFQFLFIGLFFGVIGALLIYNIFIFIFTKDIAYLWYCLYISAIILHQLYYLGVLEPFILNEAIQSRWIIDFSIVLLLIFIPFFTREFLKTHIYLPKFDKILKFIPFYILICFFIFDSQMMISFMVPIAFVFILVAIISIIKKIPQSKYYGLGWLSISMGLIFMGVYNLGYASFISEVPYIIQISIMFEALIFSVGLANRINKLKKDKENADLFLIQQQKTETQRLEEIVEKRTKLLIEALDERGLLMKELNHRVKNNMQLIVSLLRLQADNEEDKKLIESLKVTEHRIQAMSHLHELLYSQDSLTHIDMTEYIKNMVGELSSNFDPKKQITISLYVNGSLPIKQAVYLGLIINEMLTNVYKYAFKKKGYIKIEFTCKDDKSLLYVKDDGVGFDIESISPDSLGFMVIKTLVEKQLKGKYTLNTKSGTSWKVEFKI